MYLKKITDFKYYKDDEDNDWIEQQQRINEL